MNKLNLFVILSLFLAPMQLMAGDNAKALYAVKFHADWCGSCKAIAPQLDKARGKHDLDSKDVLFVTLDLTNKTTSNQAMIMADALDIEKFYKQNNGKTGFIILVNAVTGETVGKITKEHKADDIAAMIKEKLAAL